MPDAAVVCRQLGFFAGAALLEWSGGAPLDPGTPIALDQVACDGSEAALSDCTAAPEFQTDCSHTEDVAVFCATATLAVGGGAALEAQSAAPPLLTTASTLPAPRTDSQVQLEAPDALAGGELQAWCRRWQAPCCCAGCFVAEEEGNVRLVEGLGEDCSTSLYAGRVEVFHAGEWGTVCSDLFDATDATTPPTPLGADGFTQTLAGPTVVCRQLGFESGFLIAGEPSTALDAPIWIDDATCVGSEERLTACPRNPFGTEDCLHAEDQSVLCLTP